MSAGPEVQEIVLSGEDTDLGAFGFPVDLFGRKAGTLRESSPFRRASGETLRVPADSWFGFRVGLDGTAGKQQLLYTLADEPDADETGIFAPALYAEPTLRFGPVST